MYKVERGVIKQTNKQQPSMKFLNYYGEQNFSEIFQDSFEFLHFQGIDIANSLYLNLWYLNYLFPC